MNVTGKTYASTVRLSTLTNSIFLRDALTLAAAGLTTSLRQQSHSPKQEWRPIQ